MAGIARASAFRRRGLFAAAVPGLFAPAVLRAQTAWPDRPIRMIVPWPPGGSVDTVTRILQPRLQEVLGRPVVIENRGGASGSIGAIEAARAAPDGNTWIVVYDTQATNESVMKLPFRTLEAFVPVSLIATGPLAMVTHHSTSYRTFGDVVSAAKQAPDTVNYATSGVGGLAHVSTTLLQQEGGFRMVHVPYKGAGPATQDAVAGHVPLFMTNLPAVSQHLKSGLLRPLGVTTRGESPHVPGTKSFAEQGFGSFEALTWWAMLGRAGTPAPIVERMNAALTQVLREPAVKSKIEEQGADVVASGPDQCGSFLAAEIEKWGAVIRKAGITADS
ncbi:tripartite tricarboxylate transporter substrate binding protein [Roseomonas sp. E05]|uniref:Bug family tripartite tricarboxylate transporter substrate binding protein n=1 Tax=Roseomonas sp. E05 TaxID=3046310 RepID=UPI0024BB62AF|nr:tripartite tricarboxylate transporter substrate binding protein [Roseomonas sp. E05]MDJ0386550.1 tripartite tricarboxylate transporter substrate binding protein [Roseomonas sp. E05]